MTSQIKCLECNGRGTREIHGWNGLLTEDCPTCNRTGLVDPLEITEVIADKPRSHSKKKGGKKNAKPNMS